MDSNLKNLIICLYACMCVCVYEVKWMVLASFLAHSPYDSLAVTVAIMKAIGENLT